MAILRQADFDSGLWLLGGRETIPPNGLRVATGTNPVHYHSMQSRWGNQQLFSTSAISAFRFYEHRITVDDAGNVYFDGAKIYSGLTPGARVVFVKAPPHFGDPSYCFVAGGGTAIKIDSTGNVTNWGLPAATDSNLAAAIGTAPVEVTIDTFNSITGITTLVSQGSIVIAEDTSNYIPPSTGSLQATVSGGGVCGFQKTVSLDLAPSNGGPNDAIVIFLYLPNPNAITNLAFDFDLGTNFTTDYYTANVDVANALSSGAASLPQMSGANLSASQLLSGSFNISLATATDFAAQYVQQLKQFLNGPYLNAGGSVPFQPTQSATQTLLAPTAVNNGNSWYTLSIPKTAFTRVGTNSSLSWANVSAYRVWIYNLGSTVNTTINFDDWTLSGGVGLLGNYSYVYTWANSKTGSYGSPNPTPISVADINFTSVLLTNFPTPPSDPQVDSLILWRTMGDGGVYFKCATIMLPLPTTYSDVVADFSGFGPPAAPVLSMEPLVQPQLVPPSTISAAYYFNGTLFMCGDTAAGARGRIYYSAVGYEEGVAGYTDISNDDDPTVAFAVFGNQLLCFTTKQLWQIVSVSQSPILPAFAAVPIMGAPGTSNRFSIAETPNLLIYEGPDGLYGFDGYFSERIGGQILDLFRGATVEGYPALGPIVASTFGRDEYFFSDGESNTYAINVMPGSLVGKSAVPTVARCHGAPASALFFEPDTGNIIAGWNNATYLLESFGHLTDDNTPGIVFAFRPASLYSGDKYTWKIQRALFDLNPAGNTLDAFISVDGTDYAVGTITGNSRAKFEFAFNMVGSVIGAYLTSTITAGVVEVFRIAIETDRSGDEDRDNTGKGPGSMI